MKKSTVFTIIAVIIGVVLVATVLVIGLRSNWFGFKSLFTADSSRELAHSYDYIWEDASSLKGINVEWVSGDVEIVATTGKDEIKITEWSSKPLTEKTELKMSSSGRVLKIQWKDSFLTFGFFQSSRKNLRVEMPAELAKDMTEFKCSLTSGNLDIGAIKAEEIKLSTTSANITAKSLEAEEIKVSTVSGDVDIPSIKTDKLKLDTTSGDLKIANASSKELKASTTSGTISYSGTASDKSETDSVSGDIELSFTKIPKETELSSVSGRLTVTIPESEGFLADYSSVSGRFKTDFPITEEYKGRSGHVAYKNGGAKIEFSTTSGDMTINKG